MAAPRSSTCWAVAFALAAVVWCSCLAADHPCPTCSPPGADASEFMSAPNSEMPAAAPPPHPHHHHHQQLSDNFVRIEAIKQQILSKLGFRSKPNVSSSIPHEVLLETMRIVDGGARPAPHDDADDYEDDIGRTSEIISFAEPGE